MQCQVSVKNYARTFMKPCLPNADMAYAKKLTENYQLLTLTFLSVFIITFIFIEIYKLT